MRFLTAVSLLAATAFAGHPTEKSYAQGWAEGLQAPAQVHTVIQPAAPPMKHESAAPAPVVHAPAPPMVHTSAAPVVHTPMPAPPAVHKTVVAPPAHSAAPVVAAPPVHVTSTASVWEASMVAPAAGAATHTVIVGGDAGLVYTPEHIQAEIGDLVHFVFHKQNHSVTQSTFDNPCVKKAGTEFDSGLLPNPNNTVVPAPTWQYTVTAKEPTWWYCKQRTGSHCGKGMVFAINPTAEKTFNTFKEVAIKLNGTNTATPTPPTATAPNTTVTLDAGEGEKTPAPAAPPATSTAVPQPIATMAPGWNAGAPGACNCACFCGTAAWAPGQGVGSFGGLSGQLPSPWQPEGSKPVARRAIAMKA